MGPDLGPNCLQRSSADNLIRRLRAADDYMDGSFHNYS